MDSRGNRHCANFKAKIHKIRFSLALRPRPHWGSLQSPPQPSVSKGPTSKRGGSVAEWFACLTQAQNGLG